MRSLTIAGLPIAIALLFSSPVIARSFEADQPSYDRTTTVDLFGTLQEVRHVRDPQGLAGVHLTVRLEKGGSADIYLAPAAFLKELEVEIPTGVQVQVKGSKVKFGGAEVVLAREVRWRASVTLTLRDPLGRPLWSAPDSE